MILGVETMTERADYAVIPEIRGGWDAVRRAAAEGQTAEQVQQRFADLRRVIFFSPDLVQTDKHRIADIFGREIADAGYAAAPPAEAAALEDAPAPRPLRQAGDLLSRLGAPAATAHEAALEGAAAEPGKISMAELQEMMADPRVPETELRQYFVANPQTSRPFAPAIVPDPERVDVAPATDALEGAMAMDFANGLCRLRRQKKFLRRKLFGDKRPVLVSEGDSWFQFPLFLEDVIDQVLPDFNIWSVDAAGDTLQNMVLDNAEYLRALRAHRRDVRAFLFSGGGNDIVGEDEDGDPIIPQLLRPFEEGRPPEWYLDTEAFAAKIRFVEDCYRMVIENVSAEHPHLPIVCHGYDYAIPGGYPGDTRNPFWAAQDQWIGRPLREDLGITDPALQQALVRLMIDCLNERLKNLCGGNNPAGAFRNVWHVDCRGLVVDQWADELHPTDRGFQTVASRFLNVLASALGHEAAVLEIERADGIVSPNAGDDAGVHPDELAPEWVLPPFEAVRPWRVAECLRQLKRQVDAMAPGRKRASDGTIGDAAHAGRRSDHNPWVIDGEEGVVTAMDITHDPDGNCDADQLAEAIRRSEDPRVKYIIWNYRIASAYPRGDVPAWEWRPYGGSNPHTKHVHISVKPEKASYDHGALWRV
jgi:hypothetical protein